MTLDKLERSVRAGGAVGTAISAVAIYAGLWRQSHQPGGRATQEVPALSRPFLKGSFLFYMVASAFGLELLRRLWRPVGPPLFGRARAAALVAGSLLYFPGLALMLWARFSLGKMHAVSSNFGAQLYADHRLVTRGPFAWIRHPMYLGGSMAELGALLICRTWGTLFIATSIPAMLRRSRLEEEILAAEFGAEWEDYRQRVPAWFPRLRRTGGPAE